MRFDAAPRGRFVYAAGGSQRRARPWVHVMLVLALVSSMKTSRAGSGLLTKIQANELRPEMLAFAEPAS